MYGVDPRDTRDYTYVLIRLFLRDSSPLDWLIESFIFTSFELSRPDDVCVIYSTTISTVSSVTRNIGQ
jgi:hypothetical protein